MGGLGEQAVVLQRHAQIPGRAAVGRVIDEHGVEQAASTHRFQERALVHQFLHGFAEAGPEGACVLGQLLVGHDREGFGGDHAGDRVAPKRRSVLARVNHTHDRVVREHSRDGIGATADGLAENEQVGLDVRRLALALGLAGAVAAGREQGTGAGNAGLDFVGHEQHVRRLAERVGLTHVIVCRDVHAGLALDGLHEESRHVGVLEGGREGVQIVVRNDLKAWGVGSKPSRAVRIRRERHDGRRAAVEVLGTRDDFGGTCRNALHIVRPLSGDFDGGFDRFCTRVHGQDLVVAEVLGHELLIRPKNAVVKGAGGEGQLRGLVLHRLHDPRMAMPLVHGAVRAQEVEVLLAFHVPNVHAFAAVKHDREGVVVVGAVGNFEGHQIGRTERSIRVHATKIGRDLASPRRHR